jgi:hypothetical protein
MWNKTVDSPGLYWVYHINTKRLSVASVVEESGTLQVHIQGMEDNFLIQQLLGRLLFYPANVPPPPESLPKWA